MPSTYRPRNPGHDYYGRGTYLITLVVSGRAHLLSHFVTDFGPATIPWPFSATNPSYSPL